jgi:hypothetical protein
VKTPLRLAIACAVCALANFRAVGQEEPTAQPATVLPQFRMLDLGVTTRWEADKSGFITKVTVTEVLKRSSAWAHGLREGDSLQAIDHRRVVGMRKKDYLAALEVPLTPGQPRFYTFCVVRGVIIITTTTFDLVVELTPKKKPAL